MSAKELDKIVDWIIYGAGFLLWATTTFLYFVNMENHKEEPLKCLVMAIVIPPSLLILFLAACWIMFLRADTRVSAIGKVGTDESWNWAETIEMISMFSDSYD